MLWTQLLTDSIVKLGHWIKPIHRSTRLSNYVLSAFLLFRSTMNKSISLMYRGSFNWSECWKLTNTVAISYIVLIQWHNLHIYTYTMSCILIVHHYFCVWNYIIRPLSFHLEQSMCHLHKGDLTFLNYTLHTFLSWHICSIYYSYILFSPTILIS